MIDVLGLATMSLADWATVLTAVVAAGAAIAAWFGRPQQLLNRLRYRALRSAGISRADSRHRVSTILSREPGSAAEELNWLARVVKEAPLGEGSPAAVTFTLPATKLLALAAAYQSCAAGLRRASFPGAATVPIVDASARTALEVGRQLSSAAAAVHRPRETVRLEPAGTDTILDLLQLPDADKGILAYDLAVSYRHHRLRPAPAEQSNLVSIDHDLEIDELPSSASERDRLNRIFDRPNTFDGVLPRLIDWRPERDTGSGRHRIHLSLAQTTYGSVLLDHYPPSTSDPAAGGPGDSGRDASGEQVRLVTLSSVVLSSDGKLLFAARSGNAGSHQNLYGPAVNGNLEFTLRHGISPDKDQYGLPDPLRALRREALEELGLQVNEEEPIVLGLGRFWVSRERGTYVLLTLIRTARTAAEIAAAASMADPMEGRWEVGGDLLTAALPHDDETLKHFLNWILQAPELTPHAVMTGIAAAGHFLPLDPQTLRHAAAYPTPPSHPVQRMAFQGHQAQ